MGEARIPMVESGSFSGDENQDPDVPNVIMEYCGLSIFLGNVGIDIPVPWSVWVIVLKQGMDNYQVILATSHDMRILD